MATDQQRRQELTSMKEAEDKSQMAMGCGLIVLGLLALAWPLSWYFDLPRALYFPAFTFVLGWTFGSARIPMPVVVQGGKP